MASRLKQGKYQEIRMPMIRLNYTTALPSSTYLDFHHFSNLQASTHILINAYLQMGLCVGDCADCKYHESAQRCCSSVAAWLRNVSNFLEKAAPLFYGLKHFNVRFQKYPPSFVYTPFLSQRETWSFSQPGANICGLNFLIGRIIGLLEV